MCLALKGFRDNTPESVAYSFSERGALSDYTTRYFKTFKTRKFLTIKQKEEEETRVFNSVLKYFLKRVLHSTLFQVFIKGCSLLTLVLERVTRWILDIWGSCKSWNFLQYFWYFYIFNVVVIGVWSVHNGIFLLGKRAKSGHVTPSFETWLLAFLFPPTILAIPPILPHCTLLWLPEEPPLQIALCQQITAKYDIFRAAAEIFSSAGVLRHNSRNLWSTHNKVKQDVEIREWTRRDCIDMTTLKSLCSEIAVFVTPELSNFQVFKE